MIVVQTYGKDAGQFANMISAVNFEDCKKRLRLYYRNIGKCKAMLYSGKIISLPFCTLQKDRRVRDIRIKDDRRKPVKSIIYTK